MKYTVRYYDTNDNIQRFDCDAVSEQHARNIFDINNPNDRLAVIELVRTDIINRRERVIKFALECCGDLDIRFADHYCEPGYNSDSGYILFANWNAKRIRNPETGHYEKDPREYYQTIIQLGRVCELLDIDTEWSDEWYFCDDCLGAVRTGADCYSWVPSFKWIGECSIVCKDCILNDPVDYINNCLLDNADSADTFDLDLSEYGFKQIADGESGFHPGQNDSPCEMIKNVPADHSFVFQIDSTGQFDTSFSLWVRPYDWESNND